MSKPEKPEIDSSLWVKRHQNPDEKLFVLGNCWTFPGRFSCWLESFDGAISVSKDEVVEASPQAELWMAGFISGSTPPPPDVEYFSDDDYIDWKQRANDFAKTGSWREPESEEDLSYAEMPAFKQIELRQSELLEINAIPSRLLMRLMFALTEPGLNLVELEGDAEIIEFVPGTIEFNDVTKLEWDATKDWVGQTKWGDGKDRPVENLLGKVVTGEYRVWGNFGTIDLDGSAPVVTVTR